MKALTIWQPWASLIIMGAKAYEFRKWDFRTRERGLVGQRILIHAGARQPTIPDLEDILQRMDDGVSALDDALARPAVSQMLRKLREIKDLGRRPSSRLVTQRLLYDTELERIGAPCLLSVGLGTAVIGEPKRGVEIFDTHTNDSYRADHSIWAWPLTDIEPFDAPIPVRGAQGFWNWREAA